MNDENESISAICHSWWLATFATRASGANSARARLRRASAPIDALMIAETHDLAQRLLAAGHDMRRRPDILAAIAHVLAHVREDIPQRIAGRFGSAVSDARFHRLLAADTASELAVQLVRQLPLVGHRADIGALANDIFYWDDRTRTRWTFDFYEAA
ncbi:type I-E CRISPR-associated protein Cse2/CasB [Paracoccus litorisediminis]|uniref:type I-E CRISPR-associated protein Cse2/CasB n=1 Tax=Paracoccus litorisediminis TaxID=2006130 RepID=UPI003731FDE8